MKHLLGMALSAAAVVAAPALSSQGATRAYGIQIYSDAAPNGPQQLVSFPIDDPSKITVEQDFSDYHVLAAACHEGTYYLLQSDDELTPSRLVSYDMARHTFTDICTYDINDLAAGIIVTDMTFDSSNNALYAVGMTIGRGEIVGDQFFGDFGLYKFDITTGKCEVVEYQDTAVLSAITAANGDLWTLDDAGNFWIMDKYSGRLDDIICVTDITSAGLTSMAYDDANGIFYIPAFTSEDGVKAESRLVSITIDDEWIGEVAELGPIAGNIELIGFYVDPAALDPAAPRGVDAFKVVRAEGGKEEATLSWTNPLLTIGGSDLEGALTVAVYRNDKKVASLSGTPGEQMSWTDTTSGSALCAYYVVASVNGLDGTPVYAEPIFVGKDLPGAPQNAKAARSGNGYDVTVTWTAPVTGANDGWFDASDISYTVTRYPDNTVLAEGLTVTTYTDTTITEQMGYSYGIKAVSGGVAGPEAVTNNIVSGPALSVPYKMTLSESDEKMWSVYDQDGDSYQWYVFRGIWGGTTNPFFRYNPDDALNPEGEADDWIVSPSFELKADKKYIVTYEIRLLGDLFPATTSFWIGEGANPADMTTRLAFSENERQEIEWQERTVPVTVDKDGVYNFGYKIENRVPVQFCNFSIREAQDVDMQAVSLAGPSMVSLGETLTYEVTVKNNGFKPASDCTFALVNVDTDEILAQKKASAPIEPGEVYTAEIDWTPDFEGNVKLALKVIIDGEANEDDNLSEPLAIMVIGEATWIEILDGKSSSGFVPFSTRFTYSASQTVYPANLINTEKGSEIKALDYYIYIYMTQVPADCDLEIWMANVSFDTFSSEGALSESEMTKVFDGKLALNPGDKGFTIAFDQPFVYEGESIVVYCKNKVNGNKTSIAFAGSYDKNDPIHSLQVYDDSHEVDIEQECQLTVDMPNIRMLVSGPTGGILLPSGEEMVISYDRASRTIAISGEYNAVNLYNAAGMRLASYSAASAIRVPEAAEGAGIIEVVTPAGKIVKKILF